MQSIRSECCRLPVKLSFTMRMFGIGFCNKSQRLLLAKIRGCYPMRSMQRCLRIAVAIGPVILIGGFASVRRFPKPALPPPIS